MRVTIIIGSQRKKSCYKFSQDLISNVKKNLPELTEEYIFLNEYNLQYCKGCGICVNDELKCPLKDDFAKIKDKIYSADIIIFASPVFAYRESAIMKNFFDRFHYLHFRPCLFEKKAVLLSIAARSGIFEVIRYLDFTARGWGTWLAGKIGVSSIYYNTNKKYKQKIDNKMIEISKKIINIHNNKIKRKITLSDLIIFKDHKENIIDYKDKYPEAYAYWRKKGWLNKNYYLNFIPNPFLYFLLFFIKFRMSRNKY